MQLGGRCGTHRVAVFRQEGFFLGPVEEQCGPVHHFDVRSVKSPRTLVELRRLRCFIRDHGVDLVHCWDADAAIFGSLAARWARRPFITSRRDLGQIYPSWKLRAMHRADLRAAAVVTNAAIISAQRAAAGVPDEKLICLPNILDTAEFDQQAAEPFDALPKRKWIAVVARLDPEKDVELVIQAAAEVKKTHPDAKFAIAGDGCERGRLEALAKDCGVMDTVRFLGDITSVPALLRHCAVGVLTPKANEGLSNTILEYMAAGLPVVATDCGGNRELVKDGETGRLIPVGDMDRLAASIRDLLDNPDQASAFGRRARTVVEDRHRPEKVVRQFAELYAACAS